jgi:protein required for attachment to host cells
MKFTDRTPREASRDDDHPPARRRISTWILLADQHLVRLFRKHGPGLDAFGEITPPPPRGRPLTNRTVGRASVAAGSAAHPKYEPHMNASRKGALYFAHELSDWLDEAARRGAFDRLVLVAAPRTLGDLRRALSAPVQARIVAEVDKDLTKMPEPDLQDELRKIAWF